MRVYAHLDATHTAEKRYTAHLSGCGLNFLSTQTEFAGQHGMGRPGDPATPLETRGVAKRTRRNTDAHTDAASGEKQNKNTKQKGRKP